MEHRQLNDALANDVDDWAKLLSLFQNGNCSKGHSMEWTADGDNWQQWEMADKRANIEEHYAKKEAERHLDRAIHRLRPSLRRVIEIQQSHCSSVKEIAEAAGISVAATKSRLLRAKTVLRRSLRSSL